MIYLIDIDQYHSDKVPILKNNPIQALNEANKLEIEINKNYKVLSFTETFEGIGHLVNKIIEYVGHTISYEQGETIEETLVSITNSIGELQWLFVSRSLSKGFIPNWPDIRNYFVIEDNETFHPRVKFNGSYEKAKAFYSQNMSNLDLAVSM